MEGVIPNLLMLSPSKHEDAQLLAQRYCGIVRAYCTTRGASSPFDKLRVRKEGWETCITEYRQPASIPDLLMPVALRCR
jgi:hypothetical protein